MTKQKPKTGLRPPIVTVLGHVDHGKTTLLDAIRKTNIAAKEAGGITQSIGASVVTTKEGEEITFIDTPGHAAFANMRSQGVKVADVAILVIAADDGVKPQTKEALSYIDDSNTPFIVAATKTDLPSADINKLKQQMKDEGVALEKMGGEVPLVPVSGKTGKGIDELLEMINLVAELHKVGESKDKKLEGVIIETGKDKRGPYASLVIRNGALSVGDEIMTTSQKTKVRGIFNWKGEAVRSVEPGNPAQVIGFSEVPRVGSSVWSIGDKQVSPEVSKKKPIIKSVEEDELPVILKAKDAGSLDALVLNLPERVIVIDSGVGDVNESDIFIAKSAGADIWMFASKVSSSVARLASTEEVKISNFDIIYELFESLEDELKKGETEILGQAKIVEIFPYNNKKVAGCMIVEGVIRKGAKAILMRDGKDSGNIRVTSMKKDKQDVQEAKQGEECGIIFSPQLEFQAGDMISSVRKH